MLVRVGCNVDHAEGYLECRSIFAKNERDYTVFKKLNHIKDFNDDKYHQLFKYEDEYGHIRFYSIYTYKANLTQAGGYKPYESLAFHSDENGNPLCENEDPFNNGEVNNTGEDKEETHLATLYDLSLVSAYFWDSENNEE